MSRGTLDPAALHRTSATGLSPSPAGLPSAIPLSFSVALAVRTPLCTHSGLGSSGSARRYSRNRCFFLFLRLLRCFSSPGSPPHLIHGISALFHMRMHGVFPCGFPHSDIRGSVDICSSPRLFAAYHVFLRLSVPRHPPCALSSLTSRCIALQRLFFSLLLFFLAFLLALSSCCTGCFPHAGTSDVFSLFWIFQYSVFKVQCLIMTFDCFTSHQRPK